MWGYRSQTCNPHWAFTQSAYDSSVCSHPGSHGHEYSGVRDSWTWLVCIMYTYTFPVSSSHCKKTCILKKQKSIHIYHELMSTWSTPKHFANNARKNSIGARFCYLNDVVSFQRFQSNFVSSCVIPQQNMSIRSNSTFTQPHTPRWRLYHIYGL